MTYRTGNAAQHLFVRQNLAVEGRFREHHSTRLQRLAPARRFPRNVTLAEATPRFEEVASEDHGELTRSIRGGRVESSFAPGEAFQQAGFGKRKLPRGDVAFLNPPPVVSSPVEAATTAVVPRTAAPSAAESRSVPRSRAPAGDLAFTKAISSARSSAEAKLKEIEDLLSMREGPTDDM